MEIPMKGHLKTEIGMDMGFLELKRGISMKANGIMDTKTVKVKNTSIPQTSTMKVVSSMEKGMAVEKW
jgi:hypothetical protein